MPNNGIPRVPLNEDGTPVDPVRLRRFIDEVSKRLGLDGDTGSPLTTKGDLYTYGTADARLAVGTNGTVLVADSAEATGLKWRTTYAPPGYGPFTPPLTDFTTWNNQSSATLDTSTGLAYLSCPAPGSAGDNINSRLKSIPGSTWTLTGVFTMGASANSSPFTAGLIIRDSSTDRRKVYAIRADSNTHDPVAIWNYASATSLNSTVLNSVVCRWRPHHLVMMRIRYTATQWIYESSIDFQHWIKDRQENISGNYVATPDQAGYQINYFNTGPTGLGTDASGAMLVHHLALT